MRRAAAPDTSPEEVAALKPMRLDESEVEDSVPEPSLASAVSMQDIKNHDDS